MTDTRVDIHFVFEGGCTVGSGKNGIGIRECTEDGTLSERRRYFAATKDIKHKTIGAIYRAQATDTSLWLADMQYIKLHPDRAYVTELRVANDLRDMRQRIAKLEKEAKHIDAMSEAIEPLRAIYHRTDSLGKRAIEAMLIHRLQRSYTNEA